MTVRRCPRRGGLRRSLAAAAVVLIWLRPAPLAAAMLPEDRAFIAFLIHDVKYYDTALRFLLTLERSSGLTQADIADILSFRIDLLKLVGDETASTKLREEFQRRFPNHARASLENLEKLAERLTAVISLFSSARAEADSARAAAKRKDAEAMFTEEVEKPLDAYIAGLDARIKEAKSSPSSDADSKDRKKGRAKPRSKSKDLQNLEYQLQYAELTRVQYLFAFASQLAAGSESRSKTLAKGRGLAELFVSTRGDYPVMQYDAQLHAGRFAFEQEKYEEADEALNPLYDADPPFTKQTLRYFKLIRLKAILFGARAAAAMGDHAKSVRIINEAFLKPRKDELAFARDEPDPELKAWSVQVRLEYGLALAGSGQSQKGLQEIQAIIQQPGQTPAFVTDARQALGRLANMGSVRLRARDYYEAAVGLKSAQDFEGALETFQTALSALSSTNRKELAEVAPLCLDEIGQINYRLERWVESALAYQEICERFSTAPEDVLSPAATNFLAVINKALKADKRGTAHAGLASLKEQATRYSERFSTGFAVLQNLMAEGSTLESQGKWREANEKYLQVTPDLKGRKTPFYWQAQARAWACISKLWENSDAEQKKALEGEIVKTIAALRDIVPKAVKDQDKPGAAVAALTLGAILYQRGEWQEAVRALSIFTTDLASEESYRCAGLNALVFAGSRLDDLKPAERNFAELAKLCPDSPLVASAAQAVAAGYAEKKQPNLAAKYTLVYAQHPASRAEVEKPQEIIRVARVLVEGGMAKEGMEFAERLRSAPADSGIDVERELLVLSAKTYLAAQDWNKAIAKLEAYDKQYQPTENRHYDDPYVLHDLGQAYLARGGAKPQVQHLRDAEGALNRACFLMRQRAQQEESLQPRFVAWLEEFLGVKYALGEAGDRNAFRQIVDFVERARTDKSGIYTDRLKELAEKSASRLKADEAVKPQTPRRPRR